MVGYDSCVNYVGLDNSQSGIWKVSVLNSSWPGSRPPLWCRYFKDVETLYDELAMLSSRCLFATTRVNPDALPGFVRTADWLSLASWEIEPTELQAKHVGKRYRKAYALALTAAYRHQAPYLLHQLQRQLTDLQCLVLCNDIPF